MRHVVRNYIAAALDSLRTLDYLTGWVSRCRALGELLVRIYIVPAVGHLTLAR